MANTFHISRPPQTDAELYEMIKILWGITIPRTPVCPHHSTPFAALAEAFFARAPVSVWVGSRGMGGKSRTLAYLSLTEAVLLRAEINLLGGSLEQSLNIANAMREGWDWKMAPTHMVNQDSVTRLTLNNGAIVRPLTASEKTVRGPHPQRLRLDEIDVMKLSILDSAMGQPMPKHGIDTQTVMSSTWQVPDGTMTEILQRAEEMDWPVHQWCVGQSSMVTTQRGLVPIKDVLITDRVLTRQGFSALQHITCMGIKPTKRITFTTGRTIDVTGDHLIATPEGWVEAQALYVGRAVVGIAGAAPTTAAVLGDVDVAHHQEVTFTTLGQPSIVRSGPQTTKDVHAVGDVLQVVHGDTGAHSTQVIQGVADRSAQQLPVGAMGQRLASTDAAVHDAVPHRVEGSLPQPAAVGVDHHPGTEVVRGQLDLRGTPIGSVGTGLAPLAPTVSKWTSPTVDTAHVVSIVDGPVQPVYDLGVYGELHEFVAEGIVVHNCYRETMNPVDGWLDPLFVERKKTEISARMWQNEYDLQEPAFDTRAFDTDAVEAMFVDTDHDKADPQTHSIKSPAIRKNGVVEAYVFEKPTRVGDYVIAADWAKEQDFTVISVFRTDTDKMRLVAYKRGQRFPWPVMIGWYNELMADYGARGIHDGTGVGNVVNDYIDRRSQAFLMTGRQRDEMLTEYIAAVERGQVECPRISSAYTPHKFASYESIYNIGVDAHLPDEICSFALAWKRSGRKSRFSAPIGMPRLAEGMTDETVTDSYQPHSPWEDIGGKAQMNDFGVSALTQGGAYADQYIDHAAVPGGFDLSV